MRQMYKLGLLALSLCAGLAVTPARAQFPDKQVTLIVPQTPGGSSDRLGRLIAAQLGEKWQKPVVVENRSGAGGNIGMAAFARTEPDGYNLLLSYVGTHAVNPSLYKELPFDMERDFAAVSTLASVPFVLAVNRDLPVKDFAQFVQYAKTHDNVTFGSAGTGSLNHLLGEMLNQVAGIKLVHVPYKGAPEAMTDMIGGQINAVFASLPSISGLIREGTVRALAVTSSQRAAQFSTIPTISESGYPNYAVDPWFGLFVRAGTPEAIIRQISQDTNGILQDPAFVQKLATLGAEPLIMSPDEFSQRVRQDIKTWAQVVATTQARRD